MKLPDVNVLVYAIDPGSRQHTAAERWLATHLSGGEPVGLCWAVLLGLVRVTTNPAIYENPLEVEEAFALRRVRQVVELLFRDVG